MFARLAQSGARQAEILEVVLRHGWDYMRRLLSFGKAGEPQLPPPMVLRNILVDLGPVYVKLGQLLSTRPDLLPREYIEALSTLQADVPPVPWNAVEILLRQQLRQPLEQVFSSLDTESVAAGSIAQVHRACLVSGEWVALKIQRPGLEAVVERDTRLIRGNRLGMTAPIHPENWGSLACQGVGKSHGFGGCGGLVQQGSIGDLHPRQVDHHRLEVEQGFQPSLGDLGLVGGVGGVPGRVFQDVALNHRWRQGVGIAHAQKGAPHLVLGRHCLQFRQHLLLRARGSQLQRPAAANGRRHRFFHQLPQRTQP